MFTCMSMYACIYAYIYIYTHRAKHEMFPTHLIKTPEGVFWKDRAEPSWKKQWLLIFKDS